MIRPNFSGIARDGAELVVTGESDGDSVADIVEIRVTLGQGAKVDSARVRTVGASWTVRIPAGGFDDGAAVVFGVETHRENHTTITWSQSLDVPKP